MRNDNSVQFMYPGTLISNDNTVQFIYLGM